MKTFTLITFLLTFSTFAFSNSTSKVSISIYHCSDESVIKVTKLTDLHNERRHYKTLRQGTSGNTNPEKIIKFFKCKNI